MDIDRERLRMDIEANGEFGVIDTDVGHGRTVLTATDADQRARDYFVDRLRDAGLEVRVDAVGNIVGRWCPDTVEPDLAPVAGGSHLDSVPEGGIFDGPLGVYATLESVRAMQDAGFRPSRPIEVVSFMEEEGQRFSNGVLGSSVATGMRPVENALALTDVNGKTLEEELKSIGYRGRGRIDAAKWNAWLELHVEQDVRLERMGIPVGVVTTITGITHCNIEIWGEANHAGATPMTDRLDALAAASEFVLDVEQAANEVVADESETAVATVGRADVDPNAVNVVPGRVSLGLDIRDVEYSAMNYLVDRARKALKRIEEDKGVETSLDRVLDLEPTPMTERCQRVLHDAGEATGIETVALPSLAAHDTVNVASVTDTAMLFAPSVAGISHNPREWTEWADCAAATRVLAEGLAQLAG